jgi:hypothetical protein
MIIGEVLDNGCKVWVAVESRECLVLIEDARLGSLAIGGEVSAVDATQGHSR